MKRVRSATPSVGEMDGAGRDGAGRDGTGVEQGDSGGCEEQSRVHSAVKGLTNNTKHLNEYVKVPGKEMAGLRCDLIQDQLVNTSLQPAFIFLSSPQSCGR